MIFYQQDSGSLLTQCELPPIIPKKQNFKTHFNKYAGMKKYQSLQLLKASILENEQKERELQEQEEKEEEQIEYYYPNKNKKFSILREPKVEKKEVQEIPEQIVKEEEKSEAGKQEKKQYFNKWFVPYKIRFKQIRCSEKINNQFEEKIKNRKKEFEKGIYYINYLLNQDPLKIYHSIQEKVVDVYEHPLSTIPNQEKIEEIITLNKMQRLGDMYRGNGVLKEYVKYLEHVYYSDRNIRMQKSRVPLFLEYIEKE